MPGSMRKLGLYLGLVEDDEDHRDRRYADDAYDDDDLDEPAPVVSRRWSPPQESGRTATMRRPLEGRPLDEEPARAFGRLAELAERLRRDHPDARDLSAGMSADLEQAVACGSTSVRVGTALLGPRPPALR